MGRSEDPGFCLLGATTLLNQVAALSASAKAAREMDIEGVHQMRVASRRLRAALPIFSSCLKESQHGRWRDGVKGLTKALGEARDTDVQVEYLRSFLDHTTEVQRPGVQALLDLMEARRREQQEQVLGWLDNINEEGVLKEMTDLLARRIQRLEARKPDVRGRPSYAAGLAHVSYRVGKVLELEASVHDPLAIEKHHAMRIAAKRLRYTMETFRPLFDDQLKEDISTLKGIQDLLGEMHDCDVWLAGMDAVREELTEMPGVGIETLLPGLEAVRKDRARERSALYATFVTRWSKLRDKRFLERLSDRFQAGMAYKDLAIPVVGACQPAKLAIVSDVHGNMEALRTVMEHAKAQGAGGFINLGDMVGSGPCPEEVVSTMKGGHFLSVMGNFDLKVLEFTRASKRPKAASVKGAVLAATARDLSEDSLRFISALPPEIRLEVLGRRVLMVHASPGDPDEQLGPDTPDQRLAELARIADADIVMVGHSHRAFVRQVGDTLFINPGSVGRPVDHDPRASYAVLDTADFSVALHRIEYDVEATVRALKEKGLPEDVAKVVREGRSASEERGRKSIPVDRVVAMGRLERVARRMNVDHQHAENVLRLSTSLFRQLKPLHGLGGKDRFVLEAASLLHDVGTTEGMKGHHRASYRLIMEAELPLSPEDKRLVACMARFHRKRPPRDGDAEIAAFDEKERRRLYMLTSILRVADGLDYQHVGAIKDVECAISEAEVVIKIKSDNDWTPEAEAAVKKADLFERTFARKVRLE
ncbi:MAG: YfcE family phosphodiesterase [Methanomassiliicoccus sp.]|nr:YfcE family phosphodiesterase [Methanomassiliicoccus sp.]